MNKLLSVLACVVAMAGQALAAFPTNINSKTVNIDKLSTDFSDWNWTWRGVDDQRIDLTISNNSGYVTMTGYYAAFKMSKANSAGSNVCYVLKQTNQMSLVNSAHTWRTSVASTSVPPNGTYKSEILLMTTSSNILRTVGRGKITVVESLYQEGDATYPYPSITWLTRTNGWMLFEKRGTNSGSAAVGQILTYRTNSAGYFTRWEAIASSAGGTVTNVGVSGGILSTTGITTLYPIIGLTTAKVQAAVKDNVNANGLTGTVANARLDSDLQVLAGNDAKNLTNANATTLFSSGTVPSARLPANGSYLTNVNAITLFGSPYTYYLHAANQTGVLAKSVQQGITSLGTVTQGVWNGTAIDHGALGGLTDVADHLYAVLTNGTRPMAYADIKATAPAGSPSVGNIRLYADTVNSQGALYYKDQPAAAGMSASTFRICRDTVVTVYNDSGNNLTNGEAVYFTTNITTTANHVARARADDESTMPCIGIVCDQTYPNGVISNGASGTIMVMGRTPTFLNTASYIPGQPLYVSPTNSGQLTSVMPQAPYIRQIVGYVNKIGTTNGAMQVRIQAEDVPEVESIFRTYQFWPASNSTVLVGAKAMRTLDEGSAPAGTWVTNATALNQYFTFISKPANITEFAAGLYQCNVTVTRSANPDAVSLAFGVWRRTAAGTWYQMGTNTSAQAIGTTPLELIYSLNVPTNTTFATNDSIAARFIVTSLNSQPVTLTWASGFLSAPVPSSQFALNSTYNAHLAADSHTGYVLATGTRAMSYLQLGPTAGTDAVRVGPANANVTSIWYGASLQADSESVGFAAYKKGDGTYLAGDLLIKPGLPTSSAVERSLYFLNNNGDVQARFIGTNGNWNFYGNSLTNFISTRYSDFAGPITQNVYNVQAFGFRPTARTLTRFVGKTQVGTCTVDIVESATNSAAYTTNGTFILSATGVSSTTFGDASIAASRFAGWKVRQRQVTCTNIAWTLQYTGE